MRKILVLLGVFLTVVTANAQTNTSAEKGMKMTSEHYLGEVYIKPLDRDDNFMTTKIAFSADAANDWHCHPDAQQTMFVLSGTSLYQEDGGPVMVLKPGESVTTRPNVKHWNGAADEGTVVLTMSEITEASHIEWLGKVENRVPAAASTEQGDMLIRISEIEVYPQYLDEYLQYALTVGETSVREEQGVIAIFPMVTQRDSTQIRIVEIYRDQEAYKSHIASVHFQTYKQGTLHMVKSLDLVDMNAMNPAAMSAIFRKMEK